MVATYADAQLIEKAVEALRSGHLVAFPTETVYGLGADAQNESAMRMLYKAKGRPESHPVIVHFADSSQAFQWCRNVPVTARVLAQHFWPGPLTMILPRSKKASDLVTGGQDSVGVRVPKHVVAQELLKAFGDGVAAPSANKFGRLSPTNALHVQAEFDHEVACVLDGGNCKVGIESTIIDLTGVKPQILRPGIISAGAIAAVIGLKDLADGPINDGVVRVPGSLARHYCPQTPLMLREMPVLVAFVKRQVDQGVHEKFAVMSYKDPSGVNMSSDLISRWIKVPYDPTAYANTLYDNLRHLDSSGAVMILVEAPPESSVWTAIRDRLTRAASDI